MRLIYILFCFVCLAACRFDGDANYYPITERGYLLGIHPETGLKEILRVDQENLQTHWEDSWSGLGGAVSDIDGWEDRLWVSSGEGDGLIEINLATETQSRRINTPDFSPHFLSIGKNYLLLSDTIKNQIAFLNQETESLTIFELEKQPGIALYVAPVFYLQLDQKDIRLFHETAIAPIGDLNLEFPLEDLAYDFRNTVICYSRRMSDSALFQTDIDINTFQITQSAVELPFDKVRHSPYRSRNFGKERVNLVRLRTNRELTPSVFEPVIDFEIDFFESHYYYLSRDSIFRYHIDSQNRKGLGTFDGKLQKSFFYIPDPSK